MMPMMLVTIMQVENATSFLGNLWVILQKDVKKVPWAFSSRHTGACLVPVTKLDTGEIIVAIYHIAYRYTGTSSKIARSILHCGIVLLVPVVLHRFHRSWSFKNTMGSNVENDALPSAVADDTDCRNIFEDERKALLNGYVKGRESDVRIRAIL